MQTPNSPDDTSWWDDLIGALSQKPVPPPLVPTAAARGSKRLGLGLSLLFSSLKPMHKDVLRRLHAYSLHCALALRL